MQLQFGTHDVVALKPNKADAGSASLGQGVVYRLKVTLCIIYSLGLLQGQPTGATKLILFLNQQDSSITVAFDDIPEDGLNSPLRLEKLANEVPFSLFHN